MERYEVDVSSSNTILRLHGREHVLLLIKDRAKSYLTINSLLVLALWAFEMPIRSRLFLAVNLAFLMLESLILHAIIKKAFLDAQTVFHNGITHAEKVRDRLLEAENMLENLHHHLVNCEDKLDRLAGVDVEVLHSMDDFHSHLSTMDTNVRKIKQQLLSQTSHAAVQAVKEDDDGMPELENVD